MRPEPAAVPHKASPVPVSPGPAPQDIVSLARAALAHGRAALGDGNRAEALRWLDRAHRLVPHDMNATLALATACLGHDDARAAALFGSAVRDHDLAEAWFGRAAALLRTGELAEAAHALASGLSGHAFKPHLIALTNEVARVAGAAGWCGLSSAGVLTAPVFRGASPTLRVDGSAVRGPALPAAWRHAATLEVLAGEEPLLGSPIRLSAIRRVQGFVEPWQGGLRGWAWCPGDPDLEPILSIAPAAGRRGLTVTAADQGVEVGGLGPLARPRGFAVPAQVLRAMPGLLHVTDPQGRDLFGSPLDPCREQRDAAAIAHAIAKRYPTVGGGPRSRTTVAPAAMPAMPAGSPRSAAGRRRTADVVIPVHDQAATVLACLDTVLATVRLPSRIVVVDDGSADPSLIQALDRLARSRRIRLLRHDRPRGFPASANAGIAACPGRDVVLLNSDTLVPPGWLERLSDAAASAPDIGTVTPLSNDASILSYPGNAGSNKVPAPAEVLRLDRAARQANGGTTVEIPVGVGFCLYIRRDCLTEVGSLRADLFAQGYGEENDFCLRARHLGWRHVALPGLFVAHCGGKSFGSAGAHLRARNDALLERLHPGYGALIRTFAKADPLAESFRRLDRQRWRAASRPGHEAVILITHRDGGGVEQRVIASAAAHRAAGRRPIVLRPAPSQEGPSAIEVGDGPEGGFPNLRYALPDELPALQRLLASARPVLTEVHHFLDHPSAIYRLIRDLGVPYDVLVHDYAWFCPRISLVGARDQYCGEPGPAECEACVADTGRYMPEEIGVQALRNRSAAFLAGARRVVAPSRDAAARMARHFPALRPEVVPHEPDDTIAEPARPRARNGRSRVCIAGAIGLHKGYDVLLACARDAAARDLPLEFVVVGSTIDDARMLATGRVFVTGQYRPEEAVALIRTQAASLALLPSIWPETWCLGLGELWRAGLSVAAFDIGAPAERIRRTGRGFLLPLGTPANAINNALVAAARSPDHE